MNKNIDQFTARDGTMFVTIDQQYLEYLEKIEKSIETIHAQMSVSHAEFINNHCYGHGVEFEKHVKQSLSNQIANYLVMNGLFEITSEPKFDMINYHLKLKVVNTPKGVRNEN